MLAAVSCSVGNFKAGDSNVWVMIGDSADSCWDHDHDRQLKVPFKVTSASNNDDDDDDDNNNNNNNNNNNKDR